MTQLGLIWVGKGDTDAGFALIDEAMAAVLGGERTTLTTVVYACCDMLNACELASDIERAREVVRGRRRLRRGVRISFSLCRVPHLSRERAGRQGPMGRSGAGASCRVADCGGFQSWAPQPGPGAFRAGLRVRQGRLEEAESMLTHAGSSVEAENEAALWTAALALARGDEERASRGLEQRMQRLAEHRTHLAIALDLLVDAHLAANDLPAAASAAQKLDEVAAAAKSLQIEALARARQAGSAMPRATPRARWPGSMRP